MEYAKTGEDYFIRIDKDENIFECLEEFASKEELRSGHMSGIGALKDVVLGFYHLDTKTYDRKEFPGEAELLSLDGNLTILDGKPFFHIHTVLGGPEFNCYGGHLFNATVAVTCEISFRPTSLSMKRVQNPEIGLNLIKFCGIANE